MVYDKPITVQVQDPDTEQWTDKLHLHAYVNKASGSAAFNAGADQYRASLTFQVRYCKALEDIAFSPQPFRIVYRGRTFKVTDYDDYLERHATVKLVGELYE